NNAYLGTPDMENWEFDWHNWNRLGMAIWRATGGSEEGFVIFDAWSQKNASKYNAKATRARWEHYSHSPPDSISFGSIRWFANKADQDWNARYDRMLQAKMREANRRGRKRQQQEDEASQQAKQEEAQQQQQKEEETLLKSSAEFVAGFTPPDYLIDGLIQR